MEKLFSAVPPLSKDEEKQNKETPFLPLFFGPPKWALSPMCILEGKNRREIKVQSFRVRARQVAQSCNHPKSQKEHNSSNWTAKEKTVLSRLSSQILI